MPTSLPHQMLPLVDKRKPIACDITALSPLKDCQHAVLSHFGTSSSRPPAARRFVGPQRHVTSMTHRPHSATTIYTAASAFPSESALLVGLRRRHPQTSSGGF